MKIVIIGAGISGLTTYLFLRKNLPKLSPPAKPHEILIYDAYDTSKNMSHKQMSETDGLLTANTIALGAAIGIGGNGLNVLKRLDEDLFHDVVTNGHTISGWRMTNARGWNLLFVANKTKDDPPINAVMLPRQSLWTCLRNRVPNEDIFTKKVSEVVANAGTDSNIIKFSDGSADMEADLIIGADGLRSIVRRVILDDPNGEAFPPHYEGLVGVGGFVPSSYLKDTGIANGEMGIVFGANGFFGYGYMSSSPKAKDRHLPYNVVESGETAAWWSTYYLEECPEWRDIDKDDAKNQLVARHSSWKNPTIQKIVENVSVDTVWPTWTTPELPTWERAGLVLIGDSAHALQPSSGQGACQALEDSECFALLLSHYLKAGYRDPADTQKETETDAVNLAAKKYVEMRMPRTKKIRDRSQKMSAKKKDISFVEEMMLYLILWIMGKIPFTWDTFNDEVNNYNVEAEVRKAVNCE